ncbi:MAG: hypothetical protein AAGM22_07170, partial [Acidobacteriota bacterium]
ALTPGLVLLTSTLPGRWIDLQRRFGGWLAAAVALTAAYPWLHQDPLLLLETPWPAAALAVAVVGAAAVIDRQLERRSLGPMPLWLPVVAVVFAVAPGPSLVQLEQPRVLKAADAVAIWSMRADEVGGAKLDSSLVHGAHLEPGTPVADVELLNAAGQVVASKPLLAGFDTADWAAGRPDIAATLGDAAPEAWSSRPAPDGTFFERRYRATLRFDGPLTVTDLRIRRRSELPELTQLVVRRLEIRR